MIAIYIVRGIYPFGTNMYLRSDMYHQYCPFFSELWDKIRNGGSFTYTWDIGLGMNFTALYGYYLSSPLNWFIGFFPHKYIVEMMSIIILIKLSLSSVTFTYYISKRFKRNDITISIFAMFYALSGFTAAYSWNLMWFDCLLLLPIVILGLERLVNEGKGLLYAFSLGLLILSNYYIAIMVCISLVFYFIVLLITIEKQKSPVAYLKKTGYFAIFSLLAGGLAAVLLVPEIYALGLTASSEISFPKTLTQYFSMVTVLNRHLMDIKVCTGLEHLPNIYCGVAVFLLFPLYIFNKNITSREKACKTLLLFIFIFAFSFNIPNFIWHGFHYPNSLPARQSFIYVFILLTMCYDAFKNIEDYTPSQIVKSLGIFLIYLIWLDHSKIEDVSYGIIYCSAIFMGLYVLLYFLMKKTKLQKFFIIFLLFCVSSIECTVNMEATGYSTTSRTSYYRDYDAVKTLTTNLAASDTSFYRIAKIYGYRSKNDSAWHDFNSASTFSSTAYAGITDLFGRLGLEHSMNAYADHGATPLVYAMLDIKYLLSNKILKDPLLELVEAYDGEFIYKEKYSLPLGYIVPTDINTAWNYKLNNPFAVQNNFAKATTGITSLFNPVEYEKSEDGAHLITITPSKDEHIYVYIGNKSVKTAILTRGEKTDKYAGINHGRVIDCGWCKAGETFTIEDEKGENSLNPLVYTMDVDKYIEVINALNSQPFVISDWSEDKISGTINVTNDSGILMMSIPYDPSWIVKVNGEKQEIISIADALIGIELSQGMYEIEMEYHPRGVKYGIIISIISLLTLLVIYGLYRTSEGKSFVTFFKNKKKNFNNIFDETIGEPVDKAIDEAGDEAVEKNVDEAVDKNVDAAVKKNVKYKGK